MTYSLYRIEDDETTTLIDEYPSITEGILAGQHTVDHVDYDYAYCLHTEDDIRVSTFGKGRIGYRKWAMRSSRLHALPRSEDEYIHSVDDRYERDEDAWVS